MSGITAEEIKQKIPVAFFAQKGLDQLNQLLLNEMYYLIPSQLDIIWSDLGPNLQTEIGGQPSKEIDRRDGDLLNFSYKKFGISEKNMRLQYGLYSGKGKARAAQRRHNTIVREYAIWWKNELYKVLDRHEMLWTGKEQKKKQDASRPSI